MSFGKTAQRVDDSSKKSWRVRSRNSMKLKDKD